MRSFPALLSVLAVLLVASTVHAQKVTLAATPPMGWNGWNSFGDRVDDFIVRAEADAMVSSGMKDAGYLYVNLDDGWQGQRDASGVLHPNKKFPDMKALADYVHSRGLLLGIYSSPGPTTCAGYEGSYGHEQEDAETYAGWGVDYLKYDWCSADSVYKRAEMRSAFAKMGDALRRTGRPIVYSLCQYGIDQVWQWGPSVGAQLWRTTEDISPYFTRVSFLASVQGGLEKFAGPGHWNDPDMLEIGNGDLDDDEARMQMSLWSLLAAPLLAGNDVTRMRANVAAILTNREVVAIDQDPAGKQGYRVAQEGPLEVWMKPLASGAKAVGLFNLGAGPAPVTVRWKDIGLGREATVRDVWTQADVGRAAGSYTAVVAEHGVRLVVLR
jgi:alpha-galactosidase